MAQIADSRAAGPGAVILLAAVAVGGMFLFREPLLSSRPKETASFPVLRAIDETVEARLWQDPLQAIRRDWDRLVGYRLERRQLPPSVVAPPTIARMREIVQARTQARKTPGQEGSRDLATRALLIVAALVNGGPYADNAESRRRDRYALISALTGSEYVPADPERIGYFLAPQFGSGDPRPDALQRACAGRDEDAILCPLPEPVSLIGFEWFKPRPTETSERAWKSVLVLWLNSREFAEHPLHHVASLLGELAPQLGAADGTSAVLIGPPDSGALLRMYESGGENPEGEDASARFTQALDGFPRDARALLLALVTRPGAEPVSATARAPAFDPDPAELGFLWPKDAVSTDYVVNEVDDYLDYGLPPDARAVLTGCLNSGSNLEMCLQRPVFAGIKDSDPDWRDTVVLFLGPVSARDPDAIYPEDVAGLIRRIASGGEAWMQSLLIEAHEYLDFGLPQPADPAALRMCLAAAVASGAEIGLAARLSACLGQHLITQDLDPIWESTVVDAWLARNAHFPETAASQSTAAEVRRSRSAQRSEPAQIRAALHVLSPRSTVPMSLLLRGSTGGFSEDPTDWDEEVRKRLGVATFRSVLARDHVVLRSVARELIERGLDVECTNVSPVGVVSELDSNYGRAMRHVVEDAILSALREADACDGDNAGTLEPASGFGYLRGVDGEVPPAATSDSRAASTPESAPAETPQAGELFFPTFEPPVGRAQMDYVRRLADHIGRAHVQLHARGSGFQAIGVFGADIYDKQLVLQALRERLPGVRLFTTDLDARLTDPNEYRWNGNLIVGSAYGLSPQGRSFEVPPFRDSYQTAFYTAVETALHENLAGGPQAYSPSRPRVFEIGRKGAIDITLCAGACDPAAESGWLLHAGDGRERALRILALVAPLLVLGLVSHAIGRRLPAGPAAVIRRAHATVWKLTLASAIVIGIALWFWHDADLEPLFLFEGISAVPTLVLHCTAMVYAVAIIIIGASRVRQSDADIAAEFPAVEEESPASERAGRRRLSGIRERVSLTSWARQCAESARAARTIDVRELWKRYRERGRPAARVLRALPWAVLWTAVVVTAISRDADPLLARGIGEWADYVRVPTVLIVLISVYLFSDALRLGQTFVHALSVNDVDGWTRFPPAHEGLPHRVKCRWRTMQLIATHTESVSPLIVLPFILVFLLLLARSTLFDGWVWTPTLIAIYGGFSIHLLVRAFLFQREASAARDRILGRLDVERHESGLDERTLRRIDLVMEEIREIRSGAFVPWTRHPLLQSVALPSSGVGLLALLNTVFA